MSKTAPEEETAEEKKNKAALEMLVSEKSNGFKGEFKANAKD